MGKSDVGNILIGHEFPDAIRGNHHDLDIGVQFVVLNNGFMCDTNTVCDVVSKRSRHGKTWDVLTLDEYTHWSSVSSIVCLSLEDSTTFIDDSILLFLLTWLIVFR